MDTAARLAERCRELERHGLNATAAERAAFDELLGQSQAGPASWANLYLDFLDAYAPEQRRARGVYYTPVPVVAAQVRLAAELLEDRLGCRTGFADERVLVVDPAAGSGAYPLAVMAHTTDAEAARRLQSRMRLFEPLAGAASLARALGFQVDERDVLTTPLALDAPIVVCLGNPPYRRTRRIAAPAEVRQASHRPGAGIHLKNAYNDYVYFWRWAVRAGFEERRGPGIVSFVSASSYVQGPGFGGLRHLLRQALDELWLIDLEGDQLAARPTDNVFPIRTPVAIAMGVRYGESSTAQPAAIHYARLTGNRAAKLAELDRVCRLADLTWRSTPSDSAPLVDRAVPGNWCAPLTPRPGSAYERWPQLTDLFPWQLSGAQLKRTWPIAPTPAVLDERWQQLLRLTGSERATAFHETRDRTLDSTPPDLRDPALRLEPLRALQPSSGGLEPGRYAYRSFDRQWVLPDARLGDFMRPALWRVAGPRQIFLVSLLTNILGPGPAAVATALVPDLDCFRGSFGARAVIPLWRDAAATVPNVAAPWLDWRAARYGCLVDAPTLMAYCYALLSARGYVKRFEEELRTPGARIPFPRDAGLFIRAVELGRRSLWLHTFGERCRPPGELSTAVPTGATHCVNSPGPGYPSHFAYDAVDHILRVGDGVFGALSPAVWEFSVSGMRVVPSWLRRRISSTTRGKSPLDAIRPKAWTPELTRELLEVIWVIEATLALEPALEAVLDEIVGDAG